jgi:hypothetical protein
VSVPTQSPIASPPADWTVAASTAMLAVGVAILAVGAGLWWRRG